MRHNTEVSFLNAISQHDTGIIVDSLINELNENFLTNLGSADVLLKKQPVIEDDSDIISDSDPKLIFVGCSHAARMAAAADARGVRHAVINLTHSRISAAAIADAADQLADEIAASEGKIVIVYMLYDNNIYFSASDDGSRSLPVRGVDSRYHVHGNLEVADHATVKLLVNTSTPLLRAGGENEKIVLSPLPRYIVKCCGDSTHVANRKDPSFKEAVSEGLGAVKKSLKDLIFGKRIRNFKVLDPVLLMNADNDDVDSWAKEINKFWQSDPVHLTSEGYSSLLSGLLGAYGSIEFNCTRDASGDGGGGPSTAAGRNRSRQSWVLEDDTMAHRNTRGGRGGRPGRGGVCGGNRGLKRGGKSGASGGGYEGGRGRGQKHFSKPY
jgi:hypothetical protein